MKTYVFIKAIQKKDQGVLITATNANLEGPPRLEWFVTELESKRMYIGQRISAEIQIE